jgi:hypothetical protein
MDIKSYRVTCLDCSADRTVKLAKGPLGTQIDWMEDGGDHKIISFRERLDSQFGWQCLCGNDDLMSDQEHKQIANKAAPKPQEIKDIVDNLIIQKPKFKVEAF